MARALSVKVPVVQVLKILEKKLAEMKKLTAARDKILADHEKEMEKYKKAVQKFRPKGTPKVTITDQYPYWHRNALPPEARGYTVALTYDNIPGAMLPMCPDQPETPKIGEDGQSIEDLEGIIRLLKMTDATEVNASSMKSLGLYL